MGRLENKVALIVGAGSVGPGWGNGKACAVLFAREGAKVFAVDINAESGEETRSIIEEEGGVCSAYQADAVKFKDVTDMMAACVAEYGGIDVLHNNVGGSVPGGVVDMPEDVWDANIDLNLKSAFLCCKYAIPAMLDGGGGSIRTVHARVEVQHTRRLATPVRGCRGPRAGLWSCARDRTPCCLQRCAPRAVFRAGI